MRGFLELPNTKALKHVTHRTKEAVHNIVANVKKAISSPVLHYIQYVGVMS